MFRQNWIMLLAHECFGHWCSSNTLRTSRWALGLQHDVLHEGVQNSAANIGRGSVVKGKVNYFPENCTASVWVSVNPSSVLAQPSAETLAFKDTISKVCSNGARKCWILIKIEEKVVIHLSTETGSNWHPAFFRIMTGKKIPGDWL